MLVCFGFAETGCAPGARGLCPHAHFCRGRGEQAAGPAARSAAVSGRSPLKPSYGRFGLRPELAPCTIHTQTKRK